ncbi:DHA2 family efflux MFS transporter permease subunit [Streptomyces sp. SID8379]|uniref:MFS transporter n=1 Tax=unclassified Streptomyces TaxID=2593676 RepID=UPI000D0AA26D|nr:MULTISPECIES: MFS transporter [unclassified Streptomyces]MYW64541.1 DHA2 family efflux MFS transporter permease subunit [Streptomyces sp. SID8379]
MTLMPQTSPSAHEAADADGAGIRSRRTAPPAWLVVAVACAGQFLVVLDVSVVNVALPSMRADLGLSPTGLQWVVNAYSIAFAGFMLLGGRAGDLFGRKRMFLVGLGLFTLASLAGGLAQADWQLLTARAVQGLGAAVLAPSTLTILTSAVPEGAARARAIATWTAVGAGGGAAGGLVGGVLTEGINWRWVLLINVPLGAAVFAAAARWIKESRAGGERRLDLPGALLVTAGTATLAYAIVQTEAAGWGSADTLVPLGIALALLAAFLVVEARTRLPLMPLGLFKVRSVAAANAAMFVCGMGSFAMWFFMTLYAQNVLGYTPIQAGLALVPSSLAVVTGSKIAPRLMPRFGARNVAVAGVLVTAAGFAWQSTMSAHGSYVVTIMLPGIVMMAGAGFAMTPLASLATSGAAPGDAGLVSGLINTSRTLGGSLGLAILSTVAASRSAGGLDAESLTDGYAAAFQAGAGILVVAVLVLLLWMPRNRAS